MLFGKFYTLHLNAVLFQATFIFMSCVTRAASRMFPGSGGSVPDVTTLTFVPHATTLESTIWTINFGVLTVKRTTKKGIPYGLNFQILLKNQFSRIIFLWSSFQPCLASVMNLKFHRRKVSWLCSDPQNPQKFSTSKILGYRVIIR